MSLCLSILPFHVDTVQIAREAHRRPILSCTNLPYPATNSLCVFNKCFASTTAPSLPLSVRLPPLACQQLASGPREAPLASLVPLGPARSFAFNDNLDEPRGRRQLCAPRPELLTRLGESDYVRTGELVAAQQLAEEAPLMSPGLCALLVPPQSSPSPSLSLLLLLF